MKTMAVPKAEPTYTVDEYLAMEREAFERHEYLDGRVLAMSGESDAHGDLTVNLVGLLHAQLKDTPCRAKTKDTKVRSGPTPLKGQSKKGMFSYPDIIVVCGEREFHDAHTDVLLNPTVIIEVLSPATEAFDRGEKFSRYRTWNPTVSDYILVSQDRAYIDHYTRQADDKWLLHSITGLDKTFAIASIKCSLRLADVYDRLTFPPPEEDEGGE